LDRGKRNKHYSAEAKALMRELRCYEKAGTHLYLDEQPSRATEIVKACAVAEDSAYMRDLISEDGTHISEIHFTRIRGRDIS
jgi:hypothetical protein